MTARPRSPSRGTTGTGIAALEYQANTMTLKQHIFPKSNPAEEKLERPWKYWAKAGPNAKELCPDGKERPGASGLAGLSIFGHLVATRSTYGASCAAGWLSKPSGMAGRRSARFGAVEN